MCDFGVTAAIIGTVVAAGAAAAGGVAQQQAAKANAKQAQAAAAFDEARQRERAQKILAAQRVGFAKAGVTLEGTPGDVLANTAEDAEIDALAIRWGGASRAAAFKAQGQSALIGGITGAAGALLTGVTTYGQDLFKPSGGAAVPAYQSPNFRPPGIT